MPSLTDNDISVKVSTTSDNKGLDDATTGIKKMGDAAEESSKKTDGFNTAAGKVGGALTSIGTAFASYGIISQFENLGAAVFGAGGELEQTNISYQSLIGNVDKANKLFAESTQYANTTPFTSLDVNGSIKQLLAFGVTADDVMDKVKKLGDVTAAGGGNLGMLSLVSGQIFAQGKMRAQDMYQVINDGGAGLIKIMADSVGGMQNLTAEFDAGGVPAQQFFDAMDKATTQGGFAFEGAQKQATTLNGMLSTLQDSATQFGLKLIGVHIDPQLGLVIDQGGLFDRAKGIIAGVTQALTDLGNNQQALQIIAGGLAGLAAGALIAGAAFFAVPALILAISAGVGALAATIATNWGNIMKWLDDNQTSLIILASLLAVTVGPAFVGVAIEAATSAASMVVSSVTAKTGWIVSATETALAWEKAYLGMIANAAKTAAGAVVQAARVTAVWVASATKTSAVWVATELPSIVAGFAKTAFFAALHAADTALAWTIAALRTSAIWINTELPKIVSGFVLTSASAAKEAAVATTAWVASSAKSSFAWVTTELPKIVAAFVVTSASSTKEAAIASAAWIANAAKSSFAWVVTELPKIVGAFVATSASSLVEAGKATVAWVTAAITSTASWEQMATTIEALNISLSTFAGWGIFAGFAIAAFVTISNWIGQLQDQVNQLNNTISKNDQSSSAAQATYDASGKTAADKAAFAKTMQSNINSNQDASKKAGAIANMSFWDWMGTPAFASGTNSAPGGMALVGEDGPELLSVPRGSSITPARQTRQAMGSGGSSQNIVVHNVNLNTGEAVKSFFGMTDRDTQLRAMGLTPSRGRA